MLMAVLVLAACGVDGPPQADAAIDLTEFWRARR
jgi:predicted small lipoprotein YifL